VTLSVKAKKVQTTFPVTTVEGRIHLVRGRKVIVDRDLAELLWGVNQGAKSGSQTEYRAVSG
jgi:hypothetical protein